MAEVKTKIQTQYAALVEANRLEGFIDDKSLLPVYASSTAKIYPYQIAAARFALRSDYLKGCILCDECSLGKTYEAILVAGQKWYEGKENILIILPSNLVNQWQRKLDKHFSIPHNFWNNTKKIPEEEGLILTTYDCALKYADKVKERDWDLVIFDEADVLSNYKTQLAVTLKDAVRQAYKLLLTPTPIKNDIRDIYGLIHFIDESVLPDVNDFYKRYFRKPENYHELTSWISQFCFRTLKLQTTEYVNFSHRIPITVDFPLIPEEKELYEQIKTYLITDNKVAYPDMDNYNLNLLFWNSISSSPVAFAELLKEAINKTYGLEKALLQKMQQAALNIEVNSKTKQLLKILKTVFKHLKAMKVNQKVAIFVKRNSTIDYLYRIFLKNDYNVLKYKDNDSLDKFRDEDEIQILITNDKAAKGLDMEYCPVVVNYDLIYNTIEMEQRICRFDRNGQKSDVLVINMLSRLNLSDVRILELVNKRTLQFNGILGLSDDIMGNFDSDISDVLQNFRHRDIVAQDFDNNLTEHKTANEERVQASEDILFTTFSKSIAEQITISPKYIKEKIAEINSTLWELIKYYFTVVMPDWYVIDDENKTLTLIEGYRRPFLFTYNEATHHRKNYEGYQKYGMAEDFVPVRGRISLMSVLTKGLLDKLNTDCAAEGKLLVDANIEPCEIGYYEYTITSGKDTSYRKYILTGQTKSGKELTAEECRKILNLPVLKIEERNSFDANRLGSILEDFGIGNLDDKIVKEDLLKQYFKDKEGSISYETERLKMLAGRKKASLEVDLKELKNKIDELQKELNSNKLAGLEELQATKEIKVLQHDLRKKENDLFFDTAQIDVDTEEAIKALTNEYNFKVLSHRKFKLQIKGRC